MLSALQVAGGVALIVCTAGIGAKVGEFLIAEGISDAIYIAVAHIAAAIGIYSIPSCNKWTLLWAFILWPIR